MFLSPETRTAERERLARMMLDLVRERGTEVSYTTAQAECGLSRSRFEQLFDDYDDLFDAIAQV